MAVLDILANIELFRSVPRDALETLAGQGERRAFRAFSPLMHQGDVGHSLYIIVKGRVRIERSHPALLTPLVLDELGPGEVVGDLGVLDGSPVSDTVMAVDYTEAVELRAEALARVLLQFPESWAAMLTAFSGRLPSPGSLPTT